MNLWITILLFLPVLRADALEPKPVPDICGFVSLQVCTSPFAKEVLVSEFIHVVPAAITVLSNPPDSPDNCIKLYLGARGIYVVGTYDDVSRRLQKAEWENEQHLCPRQ